MNDHAKSVPSTVWEVKPRASSIKGFKKPGDSVEGTLIEILRDVPSTYGIADKFVFKNGDEIFAVWPSAILVSEIGTEMIGQKIRIEYVGDVDSKRGPTKDYRIYVAKEGT